MKNLTPGESLKGHSSSLRAELSRRQNQQNETSLGPWACLFVLVLTQPSECRSRLGGWEEGICLGWFWHPFMSLAISWLNSVLVSTLQTIGTWLQETFLKALFCLCLKTYSTTEKVFSFMSLWQRNMCQVWSMQLQMVFLFVKTQIIWASGWNISNGNGVP